MEKYLGNYLIDKKFEIKINDNLFLVSANHIKGLLEVVALMQINDFEPLIDNIDFDIDGINWQKHKPLKEVISTFSGCCASSSQLVNHYLSQYYKDIGYFCFYNEDGNGHITTYIYHEGYYYFIDSIMLRKDSIPYFKKEDQDLDISNLGDFTGFIYKSKSFDDYINFYRLQKEKVHLPVPFYFYKRKRCTATGDFVLPIEDDIEVLYVDKSIPININIVTLPNELK